MTTLLSQKEQSLRPSPHGPWDLGQINNCLAWLSSVRQTLERKWVEGHTQNHNLHLQSGQEGSWCRLTALAKVNAHLSKHSMCNS